MPQFALILYYKRKRESQGRNYTNLIPTVVAKLDVVTRAAVALEKVIL
jgi:hypothetical protein